MRRSTRRSFLETSAAIGVVAAAGSVGRTALGQGGPIRIGAVLPFSGGLELFGEQGKLGLDLAAVEINAAGGILGARWRWSTRTTRPTPRPRSSRTCKLIRATR